MKKCSFLFVLFVVLMQILSCSNDNFLAVSNSVDKTNQCDVTINFVLNQGRGWAGSLYQVVATNLANNKQISLPDSTTGSIRYTFAKGSYLLEAKVFDENNTLIYRGKVEVKFQTQTSSINIYAFKNSGSCKINLSDYMGYINSYDKVRVVAKRDSFENEVINVADFDENVIFDKLAVGLWTFDVYYVRGNNATMLKTFTKEVVGDMVVSYSVVSPATTTSTSSTTTTTTTVPAFTGYRVHLYGDSWTTHKIYYYDGQNIVATWANMPSMLSDANGYYFDLTESWVAPGTTMIIFYGGSNSNRYPADQQDGVILPNGSKEVWFNFGSKQFETSNPFNTDPEVTVNPGNGATFSSETISVTLTAKNCTISKYTIDGTDPSRSATAISFTGSKVLTVGADLTVGQKVTVKVYGSDGLLTSSTVAEFTKVERSKTPTRLGAYYGRSSTSFSIWSPDSSNVKVEVKKQGESNFTTYNCIGGFTVDGDYNDNANIYGVTVQGDCHLAEYQFKINNVAVRDPYGVMVKYENANAKTNPIGTNYKENSCNMTSYAGSSINIVVDMEKTTPNGGWASRPTLSSRCDSIVYEVHVGDFTSSETWGGNPEFAGKFSGMVQSGTTHSANGVTVKTGLDHLKELGVTHVQIMPMYDFATKYNSNVGEYYNWGYDPVNYNVPEDRYSTTPEDYVSRIKEVKNMINEFHKNGIRVIMDVVYNHTFDKEMFKNITTKYYTATDLSGCGNSVDTGNAMVSRMIRDSLEFWTDEYNIDGFRFDLLGIYHTAAVKHWGEYINGKFPDRMLLMYGEPWNGYATDNEAIKVRMSAVSGMSSGHIGVFNGKYRETIKGSSDSSTKGYMFNSNYDGDSTPWNVTVGLRGSGTSLGNDNNGYWTRYFTATPDQSINYITAHDNLCLLDKIVTSGVTSSSYQQAIVKFGHGILLVSQGIPFIHCGDEFMRTKKVGSWAAQAHNSYMYGQEMNQIDWSTKAANYSLFKYHSDLIALRKAHDGLRNRNGVGSTTVSGQVITYTVTDTNGTKLNIVINPGSTINKSGLGTQIFNKNGSVNLNSTECEGTGVIIFKE